MCVNDISISLPVFPFPDMSGNDILKSSVLCVSEEYLILVCYTQEVFAEIQ
jgi:hypothetical protein